MPTDLLAFLPATPTPLPCPSTTAAGRPCRAPRMRHASACVVHLTTAERGAARQRINSEEAVALAVHDVDPACYAWPITAAALADAERVNAIVDQEDRDYAGWGVIESWQNDRCAICGLPFMGNSVLDHDHRTGLVRARLHRGCNVEEGCGDTGIFRRYRLRNPATMLGIESRYYSPWSGWAKPDPVLPWSPDRATRPVGTHPRGANMTAATVRRAALAVIRDDEDCTPPQFVRLATRSTVHVVTPADACPELGPDRELEIVLRTGLGVVFTVCGRRLLLNRGGLEESGHLVSHFPDNDLCRACWRPFGTEHGHRLFAANQAEE